MWLLLNIVEDLGKAKKILAGVEMALGVYSSPSLLALAIVGMFKGNLATLCCSWQPLGTVKHTRGPGHEDTVMSSSLFLFDRQWQALEHHLVPAPLLPTVRRQT